MPTKYLLILLLFLEFACSKRLSPVKSVNDEKINHYEEDLSGVRPVPVLTGNMITPEDSNPDKIKILAPTPKGESTEVDKILKQISIKNESISEAQGFRIQVFNGNSRTEFESAKGYLLQYFPELEVYESFSQPTYRIKTGDFLRKMDAERYYSNLVNRFSTAKIIMDKIDIKKGFNIN